MARFLVNIQLEILVVIEETASLLENGEMVLIALLQHGAIITTADLSLYFNALPPHFRSTHCNRVAPAIYEAQKQLLNLINFARRKLT